VSRQLKDKKSSEFSESFDLVPHIGELSNQYTEELQLIYKLKLLVGGIKVCRMLRLGLPWAEVVRRKDIRNNFYYIYVASKSVRTLSTLRYPCRSCI